MKSSRRKTKWPHRRTLNFAAPLPCFSPVLEVQYLDADCKDKRKENRESDQGCSCCTQEIMPVSKVILDELIQWFSSFT